MYVVSVLIFAGLHVLSASSPFEVGPYLIMAIGFVVAYHYSELSNHHYVAYDK